MTKNLLLVFTFLFTVLLNKSIAQPADAEVATFASPATQTFCPAQMPITINIYNNDLVDITEVVLDWTLNGNQQLPVTWTGLLAAGDIVAITLDPNFSFLSGTQNDIQVMIQSVNTTTDPNSANDVGTATFYTNEVFMPLFYWNGCSLECLNKSDYLSIQWYKDGSPDPNAPDTGIYTPNAPGNYTMVGLTYDSCDATADTTIFVNPPTFDITALGVTAFCAGDSVGLAFSGSEPATFTWNTGSSLDTIYASTDGWYTVSGYTNANSCPVLDSIHVTVHPLPVVTISDMNDTLVSDYSGLHQWYLNGTQIGGAHDSTYVPTQSGIYYTTVTDVYGCVGTSNSINWIFPGISIPVASSNILMYPNPAKDQLNIRVEIFTESLQLQIIDAAGRVVQSEMINNETTINISNLAEGVYQCVFIGRDSRLTQKLVKTF